MSFSSPLDTEGVLLAPLVPFGEVQVLSLFCASCIFKLWLCFCAQRSKHRFLVPQDYPFPQQFAAELRGGLGGKGVGIPFVTVFLSLTVLFCHSLCLLCCGNCSVGSQFSKRNPSSCRCNLVFCGGGEFKVFLCHFLGPKLLLGFYGGFIIQA